MNLLPDKTTKLWRSGNWDIPHDLAESLVGGWVYLHPEKAVRSEFGGRVVAFEPVTELKYRRSDRVILIIESRSEGRGQRWRGRADGRAWSGGLVELTLPHEAQPEPS